MTETRKEAYTQNNNTRTLRRETLKSWRVHWCQWPSQNNV